VSRDVRERPAAGGTWDHAAFAASLQEAGAALAAYVAESEAGRGRTIVQPPIEDVERDLELRRWMAEGGMDAEAFGTFLQRYLERTTRLHHPGEMAHQVAVPDVGSALADVLHGVVNNPMAIYEMGPAGAAIERVVIEWMLRHAGFFPATAGGVLTHGGSLANLTAMLAARAWAVPEAWQDGVPGDLAILAPPSAHYSIGRAVSILGLGQDALVPLDVDALERIDVPALERGLRRAADRGRRPIALVAAACATSTGLYDDLQGIAAFCQANELWLHVDAAHGASALVSPRHRGLLSGVEHADSVVWDAHKLLRTSALCAAVLVRDSTTLDRAFQQEASYLFYEERETPGVDLLSRAVECTKATLGLRLFLNLAFQGPDGMAAYLDGRFALTRAAHDLIQARPGFSCPYVPESNILCFRHGEDDARQLQIRDRLIQQGDYHLSSAVVGGHRYLRLTITAPSTSEATVEGLLDAIERL
jgi:L-2,4-diaminobutyrate decarboxylase